MKDGVHVRGLVLKDPKDPEGEVLLRVEIWPIAQNLLPDLLAAVQAAANQHLTGLGITSGEQTNLTAKGPTQ